MTRSLSSRRSQRSSSGLVGRGDSLALLHRLVLDGASLVSIVGPAGVGKTALTRKLVETSETFSLEMPTWWCDVTEADGLRGLLAVIAKVLGVPLKPGATEASDTANVERLGEALGAEPCLLVLDNFEHLVSVSEASVGEWLVRAPELRVLVTSREPLRLAEERVHELAPLGLPTSDGDVLESDAVVLWLERVRARDPDYLITPEELPIVGRLACELDGIPLAIELAAARSSVLTPSMLLSRLDHRFDVLREPSQRAPSRHRGLRAAIDVSWNLLQEDGRRALMQCSIFRDGFSMAAAEAVIDLEGLDEARSVLDVIQDLREKSLIQARSEHEVDGEKRFQMALSIRAYAEEKLALDGSARNVVMRHGRYFRSLAEELSTLSTGRDAVRAQRVLSVERENLLNALRRGVEPDTRDIESVLRTLIALEEHMFIEGQLIGQLGVLTLALGESEGLDPRLIARAFVLSAEVRIRAGQLDLAEEDVTRAMQTARAVGASGVEARAYASLALIRNRQSRKDADSVVETALQLARAAGDRWVEGLALARGAAIARTLGRFEIARKLAEEAALVAREVGAGLREHLLLMSHVGHLADVGDLETALALAEQALAIDPSTNPFGAYSRPHFLLFRGSVELELGHCERASATLLAGVELAALRGDVWIASWLRGYRAFALRELGALSNARAELTEAAAGLRKTGEPSNAGLFTAVAGAIEADLDRIDVARNELAAADVALANIDNDARTTFELCMGHLDLAEARRAHSEGRLGDERGFREAARARLDVVRADGAKATEERGTATRGACTRLMSQVLERALRGMPKPHVELHPTLRLEESGRWVETPGGDRLACEKRPVLRRVLLALGRAHRDHPGRAVAAKNLLAEGWPGERIRPDAARNRLYMMISRLRGLGLRDALRAEGDGYLLSPDLAVEIISDP